MKANTKALLQSGRSIVILDAVYIQELKDRIEGLTKERDQFLKIILENANYNLGLEESRAAHLDPTHTISGFDEEEKTIELIPYKPIGKSTWKERSFQRTRNLTPPPLEMKEDASSN